MENEEKKDFFKSLAGALKERDNPKDLKSGIIARVEEVEPLVIVSFADGKIMLTENDELLISEFFRLRCNIDATGVLSETVPENTDNAEAITEVWPAGVEPLKGEMNADAEFVVEKPGYYGIKCHPHFTMGMVALIVAGEPTNKDQLDAFKAPGGAKKRWDDLVMQLAP